MVLLLVLYLEPSRCEFTALRTVCEMACFFVSSDGYVLVKMQHKFQQFVQMTVVCLAYNSSTDLDIAVMTGTLSCKLCRRPLRFLCAVPVAVQRQVPC